MENKKYICMRTIVIPDLHGKSFWKLITHLEKSDRVVFLGDYFDCYDIFSTAEQIYNFKEILDYKKSGQAEVIILIGNHDHHYFPEIGNTGTSGYQPVGKYEIEYVINENREDLQMAYQMDKYLFTHAGVSEVFMNNIFGKQGWNIENIAEELNELFKHKPHAFTFSGRDSYGYDIGQTPIWIRPSSLMKANKTSDIKKKYIQIVGHTGVLKIDKKGNSTGKRYYFVDTFETSMEYLVIEDNKLTFKSLNNAKN